MRTNHPQTLQPTTGGTSTSRPNKVILLARLTDDPSEIRDAGGVSACNIRVATTDVVKDGEKYVEYTEFHDVAFFGRQATNAKKVLGKGDYVAVEGQLRHTQREVEGKTYYNSYVRAFDFNRIIDQSAVNELKAKAGVLDGSGDGAEVQPAAPPGVEV